MFSYDHMVAHVTEQSAVPNLPPFSLSPDARIHLHVKYDQNDQ